MNHAAGIRFVNIRKIRYIRVRYIRRFLYTQTLPYHRQDRAIFCGVKEFHDFKLCTNTKYERVKLPNEFTAVLHYLRSICAQCRINQTQGPVSQPIAGPFSDSRRTFQRNHLAKTFSLSITKNTMKHDHKHSISYAFIVVDMASTREVAQEILKMWSTKARGPQKLGALWPCHSCHIS